MLNISNVSSFEQDPIPYLLVPDSLEKSLSFKQSLEKLQLFLTDLKSDSIRQAIESWLSERKSSQSLKEGIKNDFFYSWKKLSQSLVLLSSNDEIAFSDVTNLCRTFPDFNDAFDSKEEEVKTPTGNVQVTVRNAIPNGNNTFKITSIEPIRHIVLDKTASFSEEAKLASENYRKKLKSIIDLY